MNTANIGMRRLPLVPAIVAAGMAISAPTATAGDTTTSFTVTSSALSISVPVSAALGSGAPGTTISGAMGTVNVTDDRALLSASWTATVSATNFTTGGGSPAETIGDGNVSYWSGPVTATTGVGTFTPGQLTALNAQTLSTSRIAFTMTAGIGDNTASWDPNLVVNVPAGAVGGTYTGTVTHSVA